MLHSLGLVLFLGSILTYTMISGLAIKDNLANLAFAREIISTGSKFIVFLIIISAVAGVWKFQAKRSPILLHERG